MSDRSKVAGLVGEIRSGVGVPASSVAARPRSDATILIFRPIRPQRYVERMARIVVDAPSREFGEMILQRDMQLIEKDLLRVGVVTATARREMRTIEAAIRSQIWRLVLMPELTQ